jgi:hypothetical protein
MNEFTALRARAKERRDQAIRVARLSYEAAMSAIAELENRLLDRGKPKVKRVCDALREVMPTDKPFTIQELMEALQVLDPSRIWKHTAVSNILTAWRKRGVIYRVRKPKLGGCAIYAAKGVKAPAPKLGDASLVEVMQAVATKPMTPTEIMVAVLEAGYETSMARKTLQSHIGKILRRGRFENCENGKWAARK